MEAWWASKNVEVNAQAAIEEEAKGKPHPRNDEIVEAMTAHGVLTGSETDQQAKSKFLGLFYQAATTGNHLPDWLAEAVLGPAKVQRIKDGVAALTGESLPSHKTVGGKVTVLSANL